MHTTTPQETIERRVSEGVRDFGYMVAAAINAGLMYVVNHLLEWGWPSFLTAEFETLLPLINLSLGASILVNVIYMFYDPAWFKAGTQVIVNVIGLIVAIRTWQVFPFDFSSYAGFDWEMLARFVVGIGIFGTAIGVVSETVKAGKALFDEG